MAAVQDWGPSHQTERRRGEAWKLVLWVVVALAIIGVANGASKHQSPLAIAAGVVGLAVVAFNALPSFVQRRLLAPVRGHREPGADADPLGSVRAAAARWGGGVYLGVLSSGGPRFARGERAVLLLGPPRSGKTSGVIIPALLAHTGPVVSTSTKPDVWRATRGVRSRDGRVWVFDPTGAGTSGARDTG